jgi:hypothetical protein
MSSFLKVIILLILLCQFTHSFAGRCTGSAYCSACKNCSACKHCNGGGGGYVVAEIVIEYPEVETHLTAQPGRNIKAIAITLEIHMNHIVLREILLPVLMIILFMEKRDHIFFSGWCQC